jgi:hypothetical protein
VNDDDAERLAAIVTPEPEPSSWVFRCLKAALNGTAERLLPTLLRRDDGTHLLYPLRINGVHGDSGSGKGWVLLLAGVEYLDAGGHVVWVDFEDPNEELLISRLRLLGVSDDVIAERVHYVNPDEPATPAAIDQLLELLEPYAPAFVVIDSTGEALGLQGCDENKDLDVDGWARLLPKPVEKAGHTVGLVDHATKANDNPLHPSGSKRKRALISGASWALVEVKPFSREKPGTVKLVCAKDRHGNFSRGSVGAFVHLDGTDGAMRVLVEAPAETTGVNVASCVAMILPVVEAVEAAGADGVSMRRLQSAVRAAGHKVRDIDIRDAAELAESIGAISVSEGAKRSRIHRFVRRPTPEELAKWDA